MNHNLSNKEVSEYTRIPLVIGVTGHRDLHEEYRQPLRDKVANYLKGLKDKYRETPFLLLSSLSEGADQLVAAVALEALKDRVKLVIVLPVREEFFKDYFLKDKEGNGTDARADYERLAVGKRHIELPIIDPAMEAVLAGEDEKGKEARGLQYSLAGAYVARNCQILIALWDGQPDDCIGGPASVVSFQRTGRQEIPAHLRERLEKLPEPYGLQYDPLEAPETGQVYHIVTPRLGHELPANPLSDEELAPAIYDQSSREEQRKYFDRLHKITKDRLDRFNADARALIPSHAEEWRVSRGYLLPDQEALELPESLKSLRDAYATADILSQVCQRKVNRAIIRSLCVFFAAVVAFMFYAHLLERDWNYWSLVVNLLLLAVVDWIYLRSIRSRNYQNLHQDYRTLAEGLRVQFYWCLAGMEEFVSDYYLSKQKNELEWIRNAVKAQAILAEPIDCGGLGRDRIWQQMGLVLHYWIEGQVNYYVKSSLRDRAKLLIYQPLASGFLVASLLTSLIVAVYALFEHLHLWFALFVIVILIPVAVVGGRHLWIKLHELREEAEQDEEELEQSRELSGKIEGVHEPKVRRNMHRRALVKFLLGFFVGLLIAGLLGGAAQVLNLLEEDFHPGRFVKLHVEAWLIVAMGLTVALAALLQWYAEIKAFGEHHKQYKRMRTIFIRAFYHLKQQVTAGHLAECRRVIARLGREALTEHADWLLIHRERPVELPRLEY